MTRAALLAAVLLAGCAAQLLPASERVDELLWLHAQRDVALIDPALDYAPSVPLIIHTDQRELCDLYRNGSDCSVVGLYFPINQMVIFNTGLRWQSDIYAQSFVVHEAAHSLQPQEWPEGCRERHAYTVQAAWLQQREHASWIEVAAHVQDYACDAPNDRR